MFTRIREIITGHVKGNAKTYFFLFMALVIGVSAGAFTVNGLSTFQREELKNYLQGFLQLLGSQKTESNELLKISLLENVKLAGILWILGVTIIGIPFIYLIITIRGFITGFSAGFIIQTLGVKGVIFTAVTLLPKEIIIVPALIALGVNGINFSLRIIRSKSLKHISKESIKTYFAKYCFVTVFYSCFILAGVLLEAYVLPVVIRMISPMMQG